MKTSGRFSLTESDSSRLLGCLDNESSIILGDDAFHNLRLSLEHAKLLLDKNVYERIYYINLPFSGKRFHENLRLAGMKGEGNRSYEDDKRLVIYHVDNGNLAETIRDIRTLMASIGDTGRAAIIINSWEMGSRSYRYREDLIFTIYMMQMKSEAAFYVYSVAEAKNIILRRSSRAGFGKLVQIVEGVVDLTTGKYTVDKKEAKQEKLYLSDAVYYPEGEERNDFLRRHAEQQRRLAEQEQAAITSDNHDNDDNDENQSQTSIEPSPIMVGPDGVGVNVVDMKINELDIEVGQEEEMYSMAA